MAELLPLWAREDDNTLLEVSITPQGARQPLLPGIRSHFKRHVTRSLTRDWPKADRPWGPSLLSSRHEPAMHSIRTENAKRKTTDVTKLSVLRSVSEWIEAGSVYITSNSQSRGDHEA